MASAFITRIRRSIARLRTAGPFLTPCPACEAKRTICPDCDALASASAYGDLPMRWPDGREEWPQRP